MCSHHAFYKAVGEQKVGGQWEGGSGGGTLMTSVTEDENGEGEAMGAVFFRGGGGETALRCQKRTTQ
jgi:hypothetical protein